VSLLHTIKRVFIFFLIVLHMNRQEEAVEKISVFFPKYLPLLSDKN